MQEESLAYARGTFLYACRGHYRLGTGVAGESIKQFDKFEVANTRHCVEGRYSHLILFGACLTI